MIAIAEMSLRNFKGVKELDVRFDGKNAVVSGPNACGKTTIADAYLWIVNGTTYADGRKVEDTIKLSDESGNQAVDGGIEHSVEATLDVDGKPKILKKVFYEEWKKKRGSENKEMSGHRTKYFIDGMPTSASVYNKHIEHLGGATLSMVARPQSFSELETKKRRKMLLDMIGGEQLPKLDDASVARYIDTYGGINEALDAVTHEIGSTNKMLDEFPVRIDEATKNVPQEVDTVCLEMQLKKMEQGKKTLIGKIAMAQDGNADTSDLRERLIELKEKRSESRQKVVGSIQTELELAQRMHSNNEIKKREYEAEISQLESTLQALKDSNKELCAKWKSLKNLAFTSVDTCPYCGQKLPQEIKDEAEKKFNLQKAQRLNEVSVDGKRNSEKIHETSKKLRERRDCLTATSKEDEAVVNNIQVLENRLKMADTSNLEELKAIDDEIAKTQARISEAKAGGQAAVDKLQAELDSLNKEIGGINVKISEGKLRDSAFKRIDELKKQQKEVSRKYDDLIDTKSGIESVIKAMVDSMQQKVAGVFNYAKFCMYKKQINGGISQCCEVLNHDGVPMTAANTASRIATNLDIARAIAEHAGIRCPVFVDNAESINTVPDIGMQMIQLKVTEEDGLHIHLEEKEGA